MRVLSVVHDPAATGGGGLFERVVVERGDHLDRWVVAEGDAAPADPAHWDAVMVFGGAMHPDQDAEHPWLANELAFIEQGLAHGVPTFGVCLGSQLIARATGAWVGPAGSAEVGWFSVDVNDDGAADPVLGVLPRRFDAFEWHYYTFDLPEGAVELGDERRRASGVQARRPDVGDPVPRRGRRSHARQLVHGRGGGAAEAGRRAQGGDRRNLGAWNEQGRSLCAAFLDEARRVTLPS